jgi:L-iditol 2-dehydrogenase
MKQLVCTATGILQVVSVPVPEIGDSEILVRMSGCGICGTDLMKVYDAATPKPVQLGHEITGTVEKVGNGISSLVQGQRVAVAHHAPDYHSHYTRRGSPTQDPAFKASNIEPGGFAEFVRVPANLVPHTVIAVPGHVPDERAVFMEPLACCLRALDRVPVAAGDSALLVGAGAIGLLFVPLLLSQGVATAIADVRPERLDMAKQWGASQTALADSDDTAAASRKVSDGRGVDLVILTVVNAVTLELALLCVRDGGWIIPFGVKPGMMPPVDLWQLYRREVSLVTSYSATPEGLARAMATLAGPGMELESTVSHRLPLLQAAHGFELMHKGQASKVIITGG